MKTLFAIAMTIIFKLAVNAQTAIEWQNTIGGDTTDVLNSIQQTADGGYILGGYSESGISGDKTEASQGEADYWVIKLDAAGNIQWQNTIGGSSKDWLYSIDQTADGGYILGGYSWSLISGDKTEHSQGSWDYWVIKLDIAGSVIWQNTIGGSNEDRLRAIQQTVDGGYILGGYSNSGASGDKTEDSLGFHDYWVIKLDAAGSIIWQNTIGGNSWDYLYSIQQTADGGYILGGHSFSDISGDKTEDNQGSDYWVVKLNAAGNIDWQSTIGGFSNDELYSIQQTTDGGYVLGGSSFSEISGDKTEAAQGFQDYWVIKLDAGGNIVWQNTIGGNYSDWLESVLQTTDGGYILGGWSSSQISGDKTEATQGSFDYWVIKLDALGHIAWQNTIGGDDIDKLYSIQQAADGGYILGGYSESGISGDKAEVAQGGGDYWIVKLVDANNLITGNVFNDLNSNCLTNSSEIRFRNFLVQSEPWQNFATSDSLGSYELFVDTGSYTVRLLTRHPYLSTQCPVSGDYNVNFTTPNDTSTDNNFGLAITAYCPLMEVDISAPLLRRCFQNNYTVQYCNNGTALASNSYVEVKLDSFLTANGSSIPWRTPQTGNIYVFDIGDVDIQECGTFTINVTVGCSTVLGQTQCVSAHIYPDMICRQTAGWDSSTVQVEARCVQGATNDSVQFRISNVGTGDMQDSIYYYIVEDNVMMRINKFKLLSGLQTTDFAIANGSTFRLEAEQSIGHPGRSMPSVTVEGCGTNASGNISLGFVTQYPQDDADGFTSVDCQEIIGSFDPNDKSSYPKGVGTQHFTSANDDLEYLIRFQNTGTDTAFRVVVRDTLSPYLDIATVELGAASHPYNFRIYGPRILEWTFDNILLPDSNTNEPVSHGFVKFRVSQDSSNTNGIVIENAADIYFDYNAPVRTNVTFNTIWNTDMPITIPKATITSVVNATCNDVADGVASVSVLGGIEPYTYQWSSGITTATATGLFAGTHTVTVTDAIGASSLTTVTIVSPPPIAISAFTLNPTCFGGNDGVAVISSAGGVGGYSFIWSTGEIDTMLTNLIAGNYSISVMDSNGCTGDSIIVITEPPVIIVNPVVTPVSCFGQNDGSITINANGGTPPFTYMWSTGAIDPFINGLSPNTYSITVMDGNACTGTASVNILEPTQIIVTTSVTNASCVSGNSGAVDLTVSGGTTPYNYQWNNAASSEDLTGIPAGNYSVTVTDSNGCIVSAGGTVLNPTGITINITPGNFDCNNTPASTIVTVSGGATPYSFDWGDGSTSVINDSIASHFYSAIGSYTINVTDVQSCNATETATISQQTQITVSPVITNVLCSDGTDGAVNITVSGGSLPYIYIWNSGETTEDLTNLPAGVYEVTISDVANCTATATAMVTQPAQLVVNVNTTSAINCSGGNDGAVKASVTGGTGSYSFNWSNGANTESLENLSAGTYSATVSDNNSCSTTVTVTLDDGVPMSLNCSADPDTVDFGECTILGVSGSGNPPDWNYSWSPLTMISCYECAEPVACPDTTICYIVVVTDSAGCTESCEICVIVNPPTGIDEYQMGGGWTLYPNPFAHSATLTFDNSKKENCTLTLFDGIGRTVRTVVNITTDKTEIEKDNLPSGLYFFRLYTDRQVRAEGKMIIE